MVIFLSLCLWLFGSFLAGNALAAPVDFPKKEITIAVNYGPGGGRDILARGVANTMSKYVGLPVVIMNMPGAGGARGLISLLNSAPDGYTIGVGSGSDITNQIMEKQEYDFKKFTYIGNIQHSPNLWFVKSDSPFRSVKDFKPSGKVIRHSTFSFLANHSVVAMIIANRENWPLVVVGGYKSAAEAVLGVIRGETDFCGNLPSSAAQFTRAGQIRPILTVDQKRCDDFPDIPTVGEVGYSDLAVFATDFWFMAPPGVPKARIQFLEDALMKTLKDPEFLKWAKGAGVETKPMPGEEISKMAFKIFDLIELYKGDIEKQMK